VALTLDPAATPRNLGACENGQDQDSDRTMNGASPQDGGTIVPSEKGQMDRAAPAAAGETEEMRTESLGTSYLALPDGPAPYPGVVVIHEASGLNDNIRDICRRFAAEGYAALGVDLFGVRDHCR
jgi:Dienelactone hydrolase family